MVKATRCDAGSQRSVQKKLFASENVSTRESFFTDERLSVSHQKFDSRLENDILSSRNEFDRIKEEVKTYRGLSVGQ